MGTSALPATAPHLPIWRDAQRLLVWAERAVRGFARYHKYTVGTQIRQQALLVCRGVLRAQEHGPACLFGFFWPARQGAWASAWATQAPIGGDAPICDVNDFGLPVISFLF